MDYSFHITVHIYAEDKVDDSSLRPYCHRYGLLGKAVIGPLRRINGKCFSIKRSGTITVAELWQWIEESVYGNGKRHNEPTISFIRKYNVLEKYLVFDGLRYKITDLSKTLAWYLQRMGCKEVEQIEVELLICEDAGEIFQDDGIRYYMHSKENGKHHEPHVHVEIRNEDAGSFSLLDGRRLTKLAIRGKDLKKIQDFIERNRKDLIKYWNEHTDGLSVDLNQAFGLINY